MKQKAKNQFIQEIKQLLTERGWVQSSRSDSKFHKTVGDREYRYNFKANALRKEVKYVIEATKYSPTQVQWIKVGGNFYKNLSFTEKDGKKLLSGLR